MPRVAVFCGAQPGVDPHYLDQAQALGTFLAQRGIGLVYGGASVGTMGAIAGAALAAGGEVIGVIPEDMRSREIAHQGVSQLHIVASMHERKAKMAEFADAFLALPGGIGTLDELFEIWTWNVLGLHDKPVGLVDSGGYYQQLIAFLDQMVRAGFLLPQRRERLHISDDAEQLLATFGLVTEPERAAEA